MSQNNSHQNYTRIGLVLTAIGTVIAVLTYFRIHPPYSDSTSDSDSPVAPITQPIDRKSAGELPVIPAPNKPSSKPTVIPPSRVSWKNPTLIKTLKCDLGSEQYKFKGTEFRFDNKTLVCFGGDYNEGIIKLINLETFEEIATLRDSRKVMSVAFSHDGKTLASSIYGSIITLWNLNKKQQIAALRHGIYAKYSVAQSLFFQDILMSANFKEIKIWNPETFEKIATIPNNSQSVLFGTLSPDGKNVVIRNADNAKVWNLETKQVISIIRSESNVQSVIFSPDGKTLAIGYNNGSVKLWNTETQQEIVTLTGHSDDINTIAFSPDGNTLATGSYDETVKLWNLKTQQNITTFHGYLSGVTSVVFSPDGKTLAIGYNDGTIKLRNLDTKRVIATLNGGNRVRFSPDGKTLFGESGDNINIWRSQ